MDHTHKDHYSMDQTHGEDSTVWTKPTETLEYGPNTWREQYSMDQTHRDHYSMDQTHRDHYSTDQTQREYSTV